MRRTILPLLVAALVAVIGALGAAGPVATASAASSSSKILSDCTDGTIDGSYSKEQLQGALSKLSSDAGADDYSSCNDVIAAALADGGTAARDSAPTGPSVSTAVPTPTTKSTRAARPRRTPSPKPEAQARTATPQETTAATQAAAAESLPNAEDLDLSGVKVPASALDLGASGATMPTPLVVALIAFAVAASLSGLVAIRQAVHRRRGR